MESLKGSSAKPEFGIAQSWPLNTYLLQSIRKLINPLIYWTNHYSLKSIFTFSFFKGNITDLDWDYTIWNMSSSPMNLWSKPTSYCNLLALTQEWGLTFLVQPILSQFVKPITEIYTRNLIFSQPKNRNKKPYSW